MGAPASRRSRSPLRLRRNTLTRRRTLAHHTGTLPPPRRSHFARRPLAHPPLSGRRDDAIMMNEMTSFNSWNQSSICNPQSKWRRGRDCLRWVDAGGEFTRRMPANRAWRQTPRILTDCCRAIVGRWFLQQPCCLPREVFPHMPSRHRRSHPWLPPWFWL